MSTRTQEVIHAMMTENTGTDILDSGGAYGRHWQRNQNKTIEDFENGPVGWYETNTDGTFSYAVLDLYHWLNVRLTYCEELDNLLHSEEYADTNDPWLVSMEQFAQDRKDAGLFRWDEDFTTYNSYNGEECLSQTIQWVEWFDDEYGRVILLQVHGGCDVRGGYTAPRAFTVDNGEYFGYDINDFEMGCPNIECDWGLTHMGRDFVDREGNSADDDDLPRADVDDKGHETDGILRCPKCKTAIEVYDVAA